MCGIVGATAQRRVTPILLEGLRRLEYRGYDSAGIAVVDEKTQQLALRKGQGKVSALESLLLQQPADGIIGIAHTRWATHGAPSQINSHPHQSGDIAIVHNGIVENHQLLREQLTDQGYVFVSETDSEVIAHLFHQQYQATSSMLAALEQTIAQLTGAFSICVMHQQHAKQLCFARCGSPLVLGLGLGENFVASDQMALRPVTDRFVFLEEGDYGILDLETVQIFDESGAVVKRKKTRITDDNFDHDKGAFRHYMLKEIYEQPTVISKTLLDRIQGDKLNMSAFNASLIEKLKDVKAVTLVACGTSYHACMVAKFWIEEYLAIPVVVEIASEYRYRNVLVPQDCLYISLSQSGETADTMAALQKAKTLGYLTTLAICNVANSSLVRESDFSIMTQAGTEIGVASTKAFTTQLVVLLILTAVLDKTQSSKRQQASSNKGFQATVVQALQQLPHLCESMLSLDKELEKLSHDFASKHHALFLGRGIQYPVAKEGALKIKEISYIHAEAYPAGELKHGPLALIDENMPVIAVAPNNDILEKITSNLEEVKARGGKLYVFADKEANFESDESTKVINLPHVPEVLQAIVYSIPLQLLAYHVAIVKGTDVDQPRNLAKSVTVE